MINLINKEMTIDENDIVINDIYDDDWDDEEYEDINHRRNGHD